MRKFSLYLLTLSIFSFSLNAQNSDSLWAIYKNTKQADTTRLIAIGQMAKIYLRANPDSAILLLQKQVKLAQQVKNKDQEAAGLNTMGTAYFNKGAYPAALKYHLKALKIREATGDKQGAGVCKLNIGNIYLYQSDFTKALEYYTAALKLAQETGDKQHEAYCFDNIAVVCANQGDVKKALEYFLLELDLYKKNHDDLGQANCLGNIGAIYSMQKDYAHALENHRESLKARKKINDLHGIGVCYINIAGVATRTENYKLSIAYLDSCIKLAKSTKDIRNLLTSYEAISGVYQRMGSYKDAFENHVKFKGVTDSIFNVENSKQLGDLKTNFEVEKKEAQLKAEQEKKDAIAAADVKRQQIILFSVAGAGILILVFAVFIFRNLRVTRKQKNIITEQKILVEEKHREITDSINYAERIQRSLLASKELLQQNLNEHFVLFKPKDIVSGDFYWATRASAVRGSGFNVQTNTDTNTEQRTENTEHFYLAVCDSTGHGVPGAIMSILNIACLEKAVEAEKLTSPNEILDFTRHKIIDILKKDGTAEGGKDGMDGSLLCFDFEKKMLTVAAANNAVWIVRGKETIEIKADKMPVGKHDKQHIPFTLQQFQLQAGDMIYSFTDGYTDQFGGTDGKKFMSKNFRELLASVAHLPVAQQQAQLEKTFTGWIGGLEQVDDVTVVGIRVA